LNKIYQFLRRQGFISNWFDHDITAGQEWISKIDEHLKDAQIILLLISPSFLASDYSYGREMKYTMERHKNEGAIVIPIILRPVDRYIPPMSRQNYRQQKSVMV